MASGSTIYRASLVLADLDDARRGDYELRLARHPSETEERLMLRLLAFAMFADPRLEFGRGISTADEADLWLREEDGTLALWIDLGLVEERRIRRALSRARRVAVIAYGGRAVEPWWQREGARIALLARLSVLAIGREDCVALQGLCSRNMKLHCTIQDRRIYLDDGKQTLEILPRLLHQT